MCVYVYTNIYIYMCAELRDKSRQSAAAQDRGGEQAAYASARVSATPQGRGDAFEDLSHVRAHHTQSGILGEGTQ
jgi:hypothetical protein